MAHEFVATHVIETATGRIYVHAEEVPHRKGGGLVLYTEQEWADCATADWVETADGTLLFQGSEYLAKRALLIPFANCEWTEIDGWFNDGTRGSIDEDDPIAVGDWVVAGRGKDADVGRIVSLECGRVTMREGDAIGGQVLWSSGDRTACPIGAQNDVHVYGTHEAAMEELERRGGAGKIVLTAAAQACIEETGIDPQDDIRAVRSGRYSKKALLADCLLGADDDRDQGWREYVDAVFAAAGKR